MKEKIFQMIRESAEEIEVPEGLRPDKIQEKLETVGPAGGEEIEETAERTGTAADAGQEAGNRETTGWKSAGREAGNRKATSRKIRRYLPAVYGVSAAALLLLCCFGLYQSGLFPKAGENAARTGAQQEAMMAPQAEEEAPVGGEGAAAPEGASAGGGADTPGEVADGAAAADGSGTSGEAIGGAGTLAGAAEEGGSAMSGAANGTGTLGGAAGREGALMDGAPEEEVAAGAGNTGEEAERQANRQEKLQERKRDAGDLYKVASGYEEVYELLLASGYGGYRGMFFDGDMEAAVMEAAPADEGAYSVQGSEPSNNIDSIEKASSADLDYSTTNLQMEGVDESDIVKTDGSYIYIVSGNQVYITDVRMAKMRPAGTVTIPQNGGSSVIEELYVEKGRMIVIVSGQKSSLVEYEPQEGPARAFRMETVQTTTMYTYEIQKDRPKLVGSVSQEGTYETSRKIGDVVYLFSNVWDWGTPESGGEEWVPLVNGVQIPADHIYLPERGYSGLVISSVDTKAPEQIVDDVMIVNNNAEIYVTTKSIYLYYRTYDGWTATQVARFALEDGCINAAGAANVSGSVQDTFAVNESGDSFRILTTDNAGDLGNCLYLFDLNLNQKGSLTGIAKNEIIYAARYVGNIVYFVTYRNMDPLFAVDLSDENNPKLLGELKITGYSDYLHVWEDGKLFGIGYETDPDTGAQKGIKIAMFDTSDPLNLRTIDSVVLKNAGGSPAMSQYKAILMDRRANLIGFPVWNYDGADISYLLFDWQEQEFHDLLAVNIDSGENYWSYYSIAGQMRGLYIGDTFYIASPVAILSFDRTKDYEQLDQLVIGE